MKFHWQKMVSTPVSLVDFIVANSDISKSSAKKALNFGGGWVKSGRRGKLKRVRRATKSLTAGDTVAFYYDDNLLTLQPPIPQPLIQTSHWGIWYKPSDVPAQATPYGDLTCMERLVAKQLNREQVFIVHRLDKEAAGLMLIAYHKEAAAAMSELWQNGGVGKFYQAWVAGQPKLNHGEIDEPLDGKHALTLYHVIKTLGEASEGQALLEIEIKTGRLHQIRRHCAYIGHPLLGDPRYNPNKRGKVPLQLVASRLQFLCPYANQKVDCEIPQDLSLLNLQTQLLG